MFRVCDTNIKHIHQPRCDELSRHKTEMEGTYRLHSEKKRQSLLSILLWFNLHALIKLFKKLSRHFDTHFPFESACILRCKWTETIKHAYYHNNSNVFLLLFFLRVAWKIYEKHRHSEWNHISVQMHCNGFLITASAFLPTKAKWNLIAIANVHLCVCEFKWDC